MDKSLSTRQRKSFLFSPVILVVFLCAACTNLSVQADQEKEGSGPLVWVKTSGMAGRIVSLDFLLDPQNPKSIYLCGFKANDEIPVVFKSANGGDSWQNINGDLALHTEKPETLFLPLRAAGIACSNDGGQHWELINKGIVETSINLLATDPVNPATLYAGTYNAISLSENYMIFGI